MLLGFPRHALLLMFGDATVWNLMLRFGSPQSTIINCVSAGQASRASLGPDPPDNYVVFSILESDTRFFVHADNSLCCLDGNLGAFLLGLSPFVSDRTENDTTLCIVPIVLEKHCAEISIVLT